MFQPAPSNLIAAAPAPRSAALLCFPGIRPEELAAPFGILSATADDVAGGAAFEIALIGPDPYPVRTASGTALGTDHSIGDGAPDFDVLIVPCAFIRSEAFARPAAIAALAATIRRARRTGLFAASRHEARRAKLLLRRASSWATPAFWGAFRFERDPTRTEFVPDGRLLWAIGPEAAADLTARLISRFPRVVPY